MSNGIFKFVQINMKHLLYTYGTTRNDPESPMVELSGLENITGPLVFTSASGCRASENFDSSSEN